MKKKDKTKIFCIGRNKTGTTSLKKALKDLGYRVGVQSKAELLLADYSKGKWKSLIKYCKTAEVFQDAPFSWPYTWLILHEHFPGAKFILTTRDSEDWYRSITRFHAKKFAPGKSIPEKHRLDQR